MHPFAYVAPKTVKEAVSTLNKHGEKARPIAGGTDVLVQARGGRFELDAIVDIKGIPELTTISHTAKGLTFGAAVPCYKLYTNEKISAEYPGIIDAASLIGGIQIQSRAGLGGNLCNASPSADGICPLIVHSTIAHIAGPRGERSLPAEEFCVGPGRNALKNGEFLVRLEIPKPVKGFGAAYERFIPRNEMDIAVVGVAASVVLDSSGKKFKSGRIALAAVGPTPIFAKDASDHLAGKPVNEDTINAAAALAREAAKPIADMRGTVEQRKHLVEVLTRRMLHKAVQRALA